MTVAETRYGRRGGGWLPSSSAAELPADRPRAAPVDRSAPFHPDAIARARAREQRREVTAEDVAAVWAGRARMALARQAAGQPLDDIDRQAITRQESTP